LVGNPVVDCGQCGGCQTLKTRLDALGRECLMTGRTERDLRGAPLRGVGGADPYRGCCQVMSAHWRAASNFCLHNRISKKPTKLAAIITSSHVPSPQSWAHLALTPTREKLIPLASSKSINSSNPATTTTTTCTCFEKQAKRFQGWLAGDTK